MDIQRTCSAVGVNGKLREANHEEEPVFTGLNDVYNTLDILDKLKASNTEINRLGQTLDAEGEVLSIYLSILKKKTAGNQPVTILKEVLMQTLARINALPEAKKETLTADHQTIEIMLSIVRNLEVELTSYENNLSQKGKQFSQRLRTEKKIRTFQDFIFIVEQIATNISYNLDEQTKAKLGIAVGSVIPQKEKVKAMLFENCSQLNAIAPPTQVAAQVVRVAPPVEPHEEDEHRVEVKQKSIPTNIDYTVRFGGGYGDRLGSRNPDIFSDARSGGSPDASFSLAATLSPEYSLGTDVSLRGNFAKDTDPAVLADGSIWFKHTVDSSLQYLLKAGAGYSRQANSSQFDPQATVAKQSFYLTKSFNWGSVNIAEQFIGGQVQIPEYSKPITQVGASTTPSVTIKAGDENITVGGNAFYDLALSGAGGGGFIGVSGKTGVNYFALMGTYANEPSLAGRFHKTVLGFRYNFDQFVGLRTDYTWQNFLGKNSHRVDVTVSGNIPLGKGFWIAPALSLTAGTAAYQFNRTAQNPNGDTGEGTAISLTGLINIIYNHDKGAPLMQLDPLNPKIEPLKEVYFGQ